MRLEQREARQAVTWTSETSHHIFNTYCMKTKYTVLIVDDSSHDLSLMQGILKDAYTVELASNGQQALKMTSTAPRPDLILLDTEMPGVNGYQVIAELKNEPETKDIPVIFTTDEIGVDHEKYGLELGAVDYIGKPISPSILLARVKAHIASRSAAAFLKDKSEFLDLEVANRTREILNVQDVTIMAMAALAETRDSDTGNHTLRIQHYVRILARKLSRNPRFARELTQQNITHLFKSAPLHDIGKVGIPDRILLKPGKLTPEEFEIMKTHTTLGRNVIDKAEQALQLTVPLFAYAKEIVYSHHEKWDGSGYPEGLAGDQIPLSARLMALADVYDALISKRVYKNPMSHEQAVEIIRQTKGRHFDPDVVDAFLEINDGFNTIAIAYADEHSDLQKKADYIAMAKSMPLD